MTSDYLRRLKLLGGEASLRSIAERSRQLARRSREVVVLAGLVGAITGLGVAGFDSAVTGLLNQLNRLPLWAVAVAPPAGLGVAALALRWLGPSTSPSTADEYLHAFHDPSYPLPLRPLVARMVAGIATLGTGVPMGLEGPSLYLGATRASRYQESVSPWCSSWPGGWPDRVSPPDPAMTPSIGLSTPRTASG